MIIIYNSSNDNNNDSVTLNIYRYIVRVGLYFIKCLEMFDQLYITYIFLFTKKVYFFKDS